MPLVLLVALPFIASVLATLLPANARNRESTLAGLVALGCALQVAWLFPQLAGGNVIREEIEWVPALGLNLVLRMDGFAWLFCMLVLGIGALVVLYARYYMSASDPVPRFFSFFLAFMGSMMGVVLSGNLVQMVMFWELTSLFSFLLIGYWHHRRDARRGARMALTVTGAGGLCLLAGVLVLGRITGTYDLDLVLASGDEIRAHPLYTVVLVLVLLGAFTKSAQFPFHFWLPRAMAAPTPVSAYLHSATMVKLGVFLMARLWPVLSGTSEWFWLVGGAGAITLLLGGFIAMFQRDLKSLLAYSTISHLGLITLLLGLNSPLAAVAAVFHIMNHATFKASLFMAAGIIDHETGTRDIRKLSGLMRLMPITGTLAVIASASMAGVPLLNGFLSKEMFFAETVYIQSTGWLNWGLPVIATLAGMFSVAYSARFVFDVFFGPPCGPDVPRTPHEPPHWMRVPVELLVLVCLVVGVAPHWSVGPLLAEAARPVVGGTLPAYSLAVWHGLNLPLLMSFVAMAGGAALYLLQRRGRALGHLAHTPLLHRFDGQRIFENVLARVSEAGRRSRYLLGTRRLQSQLLLLLVIALAGAAAALWLTPAVRGKRELLAFSPMFAMTWVIGAACAVAAAWQAKFHRLAALMLASGAGLVCCITYIWFSAPDLALTQLAVETVTTVLLLLGLRWLPMRKVAIQPMQTRLRLWGRRGRDLTIAVLAGAGMAALSWTVMTRRFPESISPFFLKRALTEGGGTNVVNVMLVDFRGFDTFGEITVLGVVALTVYALLRRFRPAIESMALPAQQRAQVDDGSSDLLNPRRAVDTAVGYLMVPAVLVRLLLPVSVLVSAYFFMRGHNAPGGGFVAGLVMSIALLLQFIVSGTEWVEEHLRIYPRRWIALGLLLALATGGGAVVLGYPFMTTHTAHLHLPLLGGLHVPSALFFDLGVFAIVLGSTMLILTALAHQSVRSHRWVEEQNERQAAAEAKASSEGEPA
ncbi:MULTISPECIES: monovalent cation/H+ antiporter subunit A [unclassified Polaromonas]|jgi:multicomponent K+:H+ antiporter subunit A|uniref:monovalent cation/H+ antiporter subunit A n=1 Tax=unclassified Polaromonas TaxID=2638319 RepID=UPI000BD0315B|nr:MULTISPECIES: monovalent cation/H+ antiporter subunit A [unclassified Polaromonas]OYY32875.1 MAG: monovalent cation/H+ antiporter subunit A [Polaromonas sp. 35-63-35]OYZ16286.1 MAG: monovalent cation/H+ antiporter subunit A [Polaromonas sp. 16-63-31]OYZ76333.1 MAG: monovalent cation/H+ antiporter subunit A [Polaromonas sp. 24-63-21]OZA51158.1 MAG: monovalent cation/H+ antiporter subunit A [Polaromonas sp. 17-63-33]OZA86515.1 MAG: monovalent cation/H+ antiporter subunit A [Polaromonas sp. 39